VKQGPALGPHTARAFKNIQFDLQHSPPSHCSVPSLIPFPHTERGLLDCVRGIVKEAEAVTVLVGVPLMVKELLGLYVKEEEKETRSETLMLLGALAVLVEVAVPL